MFSNGRFYRNPHPLTPSLCSGALAVDFSVSAKEDMRHLFEFLASRSATAEAFKRLQETINYV